MAKFLVMDPGEFIAIDPKTGEEKFRAKTNIADANGEWANNFVKEIDHSIGKANEENDVKDVKKYPMAGKYRDALLVYFTDGYGDYEIPKPKTYRNLWVVLHDVKNLSLKNPYGDVKSLSMDADYKKLKGIR